MLNERIVSFPRMGKEYTNLFKDMLDEFGLNVITPPPNSEKTIKFGVKHSSNMICYPFKTTLGNFKEVLDAGANTLLMWDSRGRCRFRHYWILQEFILKNLGYKFEIYPITLNFFSTLRTLNPSLSYFKIIKILRKYWKKLKKLDEQQFSKDKLNIGIIGEVYCCLEESVNYDIKHKLKKSGVNPYFTITLSEFIKESIEIALKLNIHKKKYKEQARKYLNGPIGGHGFENIYNTLWIIENKINGIIHLLPLSCAPETTIEPIIDNICNKNNIPLLRLPIDETNSEANIMTRLETFIELVKRKNERILGN